MSANYEFFKNYHAKEGEDSKWDFFKYELRIWFRELKYTLKTWSHIPRSTILCLRFPFLYTRHRMYGNHHTFWKLIEVHRKLYDKYYVIFDKDGSKSPVKYYIEDSPYGQNYWTNKWAKPLVKVVDFLNNWLLQFFFCLPTRTELDAMPDGWRKAFGIQMCKEIRRELKRSGYLHKYRITDIKEKFGTLHWYDNGAPTNVHKIINKYEYISRRTCIKCGDLATVETSEAYWVSPYCDKCAPKNTRLYDFGLDDTFSWYGWTGNVNGRDDWKEREEAYKKEVEEKNAIYEKESDESNEKNDEAEAGD